MMLSALIRKRDNATATVATPATHEGVKGGAVANVASVAVANQLLAEEERASAATEAKPTMWTVNVNGTTFPMIRPGGMTFEEALEAARARWPNATVSTK